jgi:hypothetical protein
MSDTYLRVATKMFDEYNELSAKFDLPYFDSLDELEVILRDNIDEVMIDDLLVDAKGRMALAGTLAAMMGGIEFTFGAVNDESTH